MENACLTNENEATSRTSLDENGRDVYLDNVKGILIFLVVLGHYIEPFRFNLGGVVITNVAVYLYQWIYSFHMPMFAMVSGYFSKKEVSPVHEIFRLIVPYLIFYSLCIELERLIVPDDRTMFSLLTPGFVFWYFIALFVWKISLKIMKNHTLAYAVGLTVFSLLFGYRCLLFGKGASLAMTATLLAYFPFFLVGFFEKEKAVFGGGFSRFKNKKLIGLVVFLVGMGLMVFLRDGLQFIVSGGFVSEYGAPFEIVNRIVKYLMAGVFGVSLLCLMPTKKCLFTRFGRNSVTVLIGHVIPLLFMRRYSFFVAIPNYGFFIIVALSFVACLFFSSEWIATCYKKLIKAIENIFIKNKADATNKG